MAKAKANEPETIAPESLRLFRVLATSLLDAAGNLRRCGDELNVAELGNVELHLERGAIVELRPDTVKADE